MNDFRFLVDQAVPHLICEEDPDTEEITMEAVRDLIGAGKAPTDRQVRQLAERENRPTDFSRFAERHGLRDSSNQATMSKSLLLNRTGGTGLEGRYQSISGGNLLEQTLSLIPAQIPAELRMSLVQFLAHVAIGDLVQVTSTPQPDLPSWLDYLVWLYLISVESGSHPFYSHQHRHCCRVLGW